MHNKNSSLFPLEDSDDEAMLDDTLDFHLFQDGEEQKIEKKNEKEDLVNAELLKNPITDSEDLLPIVNKDTNDNDGVTAEKQASFGNKDQDSDTNANSNTSKRYLNDWDVTSSKKIKLADQGKENGQIPQHEPVKIIALNAIDEYLKMKSLQKLKYNDLEQIILQKICEVICHKNEISELRHQLGVQEEMIKMWEQKWTPITKHIKNLEIVHKKVLNEVRRTSKRDNPIIPVKITRSVGLQVQPNTKISKNILMFRQRRVKPNHTNPQSTISSAKQNGFNPANRVNTMNGASGANKITPMNKVTTTTTSTVTTANNTNLPGFSMKKMVMSPNTTNSLQYNALAKPATASIPLHTPIIASSTATPPLTSIASSISTGSKMVTNESAKSRGESFAEQKQKDRLPHEDDENFGAPNSAEGVRIFSAPIRTLATTAQGVVNNSTRIPYLNNNQLHHSVLPGAQNLKLKENSTVIVQANAELTSVAVQPIKLTSVSNNVIPTKTIPKPSSSLSPLSANQLRLPSRKPVPPKPHISIKHSNGGSLLISWKMPYNLENFETIESYQLYVSQEITGPNSPPKWRKVNDIKALSLPMACTLTQINDGKKYKFAVRAVDVRKRMGPFSDSKQIPASVKQ